MSPVVEEGRATCAALRADNGLCPPYRYGHPGRKYSLRIDPRHLLLVTAIRGHFGGIDPNHTQPDARGVFETAIALYARTVLGDAHVDDLLRDDGS